jgi:hypothetical protein
MVTNNTLLDEQGSLWNETDLLGPDPSDEDNVTFTSRQDHAVITAPVLTGDALSLIGRDVFPQTALYGRILEQHGDDLPLRASDSRLYVNTNAPFSALVCGVQVRIYEGFKPRLESSPLYLGFGKITYHFGPIGECVDTR